MKNKIGELQMKEKIQVKLDEEYIKFEMKLGKEKIGYLVFKEANFEYEFSFDNLPYNISEKYNGDNIIVLEHLEINEDLAGKGYGKKILKEGLEYLKKHYKYIDKIFLNACPMGHKYFLKNDLVEFYKLFGFEEVLDQGNNMIMIKENK